MILLTSVLLVLLAAILFLAWKLLSDYSRPGLNRNGSGQGPKNLQWWE